MTSKCPIFSPAFITTSAVDKGAVRHQLHFCQAVRSKFHYTKRRTNSECLNFLCTLDSRICKQSDAWMSLSTYANVRFPRHSCHIRYSTVNYTPILVSKYALLCNPSSSSILRGTARAIQAIAFKHRYTYINSTCVQPHVSNPPFISL